MLWIWNFARIFHDAHENKTNDNGYVCLAYVSFVQLFNRCGLTTYLKYTLIFIRIILLQTYAENVERNQKKKHIAGSYFVLIRGNYTHRHKNLTKIIHRELVTKCRLSKR
jgi:hypothetical protein